MIVTHRLKSWTGAGGGWGGKGGGGGGGEVWVGGGRVMSRETESGNHSSLIIHLNKTYLHK